MKIWKPVPIGECAPLRPSPTGYMRNGQSAVTLYAYLIAEQGREVYVRIEDTDQNRYIEGATEVIYSTLAQCGLKNDKVPTLAARLGVRADRRREI